MLHLALPSWIGVRGESPDLTTGDERDDRGYHGQGTECDHAEVALHLVHTVEPGVEECDVVLCWGVVRWELSKWHRPRRPDTSTVPFTAAVECLCGLPSAQEVVSDF